MSKQFKHALVTGRFQNFQNMHLSLITKAARLAEHVTVLVGSAQLFGTVRNPFPVSLRIEVIEKCLINKGIKNVKVRPMNDMTDETDICYAWGDWVLHSAYQVNTTKPDLILHGDDGRENDPVLWFDDVAKDGIHFLMLPRYPEAVSGTMVRSLMALNKYEEWVTQVPESTVPYFKKMQEILLGVDYYKELSQQDY